MFALVQRCGKNLCLLTLLCVLGVALAGFGGSAQSPATEPSSVGRATNLRASTVGQDDGSVRLTWSAALDAQVYFMVYLKSSDLEARNFGQGPDGALYGDGGCGERPGGRRGVQFHRDWDAVELGELRSGVG